MREVFLLTDHRWSSASVSAPPVHLKSPHHAHLADVFASMLFAV